MTRPAEPSIRRVRPGDASALARFYNGLSSGSIRTFRPLGTRTTVEACREVVEGNRGEGGTRFDLVALSGGRTVGWGFLYRLDSGEPTLGLAIADDHRRRGIGASLLRRVMAGARELGLARVFLIAVADNEVACRMYEGAGFVRRGRFVDEGDGLAYYRMVCDLAAGGPGA